MARSLRPPSSIWLQGALGSGKTTFCRGFIRALSAVDRVASPTYTLLETYPVGEATIYHFDFYRITKPDELDFIGLRDCFCDDGICLIEWPENAGENILPEPEIKIVLTYTDKEQERHATVVASDKRLITNMQRDYMRQCAS